MARAAKKLKKAEDKASAFSNGRDSSKGGEGGAKGGYDSDNEPAESKKTGKSESDSKDYK